VECVNLPGARPKRWFLTHVPDNTGAEITCQPAGPTRRAIAGFPQRQRIRRVVPRAIGLFDWSPVLHHIHSGPMRVQFDRRSATGVIASSAPPRISLTAAAVASIHVAAMLLVMGVVSVVIYERVGLGILRRGWFNLDLGWSLVLIGSGTLTLFTA
jgi:hypothetical protein